MDRIELFRNAHWLVSLGMVCALLGAIYSAYGLTQKYKPFADLTDSVTFGSLGGLILGIGLGLLGLFFVLFEFLLRKLEGSLYQLYTGIIESPFLTVLAFFFIGIVLGTLSGFLIKAGLHRVETPRQFPETPRERRVVFLTGFVCLLAASAFLELRILVFISLPSGGFANAQEFLDIPFFIGSLTSYLFYQQEEIYGLFVYLPTLKKGLLLFLFSFTFILLICIAVVAPNFMLLYFAFYALEFVFGFLIMGALIHPRGSNESKSKPSWLKFVRLAVPLAIGSLLITSGVSLLSRSLAPTLATYLFGELCVTTGLIAGIRSGRIDEFVRGSKRPGFRNGFLAGFIVFGIYIFTNGLNGYLAGMLVFFFTPYHLGGVLSYLILCVVIGSLPMGLLIGGMNTLKVTIHSLYSYVNQNKGRNEVLFGLIGIFLTVTGILFIGLQALMA